MKCLVCNEVQGNRVGMISASGRDVCMNCLPEVIDSYIYLRNWTKAMKNQKED